MPEQLPSGRWRGERVQQGGSTVKIFETEEEAVAYEEDND